MIWQSVWRQFKDTVFMKLGRTTQISEMRKSWQIIRKHFACQNSKLPFLGFLKSKGWADGFCLLLL